MANESEQEVRLYFFPIEKYVDFFSSRIFRLTKYGDMWRKYMEKWRPNRVHFSLHNKYTVFTMGCTVAFRSVDNFFFLRATVLQLIQNLIIEKEDSLAVTYN